jgi:hypothetical protein
MPFYIWYIEAESIVERYNILSVYRLKFSKEGKGSCDLLNTLLQSSEHQQLVSSEEYSYVPGTIPTLDIPDPRPLPRPNI